ncbi:LytR cell envelope-related transcriptional attenuator [Saccharothrix saharensis]|uniref:LytR cell envelope-related transcriptional attenuator n=1 Tax=Saccharothrix saharensis TaxID=571190 RepID=A0A543JF65_9PSEU|nr:LytR C-terminal domain-containing protein [Saccharothrix saharensis]TQM81489.1 LytR cell envelope-related transcriptional attenuator [Saccharothrix saharensis]
MTNPEQPAGPAHPARAAGYALLGVAVIALVIGLVSLFTGGPDDEPPAAQSTPPSTTSGTSDSSGTPTGEATTTPSQPQAPSSETSAASPPGTTAAPTPSANAGATTTETPPPPVTTTPKVPVRVYNNSTTQGLAARASDDVQRAGWEVAEKGNYSSGNIPTTTVYFRPGTEEEASARELARILNARVEPRFDGIQSAHPGIIVIVTNDYRGPSGKVS